LIFDSDLVQDPGDFSLVHDDGDEQFGVPQYSSESEWSDDDVILTAFTDVELPMAVKSRAEGALTIAAHRFATIDKGHKKSR
jgi:phospho-N-acetylmuramoyl-pentapeptide-transferase